VSKSGFVPMASGGLVEVENEVKWIVNMLIMVYLNKTCGNATSEQFLGDNISYLEELSSRIAKLQDREGRCLQMMCSW
jgi:hypothetical protein